MLNCRWVERRLLRLAFMWPLMVASDTGGCCDTDFMSKPGKVARKPDFIACVKVDNVGLNKAAW